MQNWQKDPTVIEKVAILLFPRFSNYCLANAMEPLRAANELSRRMLYEWTIVTPDGKPVTSSSGLPVLPQNSLRDHPGGTSLFVLPSFNVKDFATSATARMLRNAVPRFDQIAGMDTGAWLLAHAGLLDAKRATIHPDEFGSFAEAFEQVDAVTDRYVKDQNILTCGGALSAFDLVLDLIQRTHGEGLGLEITSYLMASQIDAASPLRSIGQHSKLVDACIAVMSSNIETPYTIGEIAQKLGTYQRKISDEFKATIGATPQLVYKRLRLLAARRYAEHANYSIAEIAVRTGYSNPAALTRAFVTEFGAPPSAFR